MRLSRRFSARASLALSIALTATTALGLGAVQTTTAATPLDVAWGMPTATATYGRGISFSQPITTSGLRGRIEVLLSYPGAAGPEAVEVSPAHTPLVGKVLTYDLLEADAHLVPNTTFHARWRIDTGDGRVAIGPDVALTYADTRFAWRTKTGPIVRVHWYEGSDAFGARALAVGEEAVRAAAAFFGVRETEPVDFFVYAARTPFQDALGPGTPANVIGEAHADIRTMFALISPNGSPGIVVTHELTHLVFDTAVKNPYHLPPRWLNEGLAVYLSEGYGDSRRGPVEQAVRSATIIPLVGLTASFPTSPDRDWLAYSEGVSAVDYLIRTYGKPALVKLVRSYAGGVSDDEAFRAALATGTQANGLDVAGFQAAWLADLGAVTPVVYGPAPAPAGPLPPGWSGAPAAAGATGAPGAPTASFASAPPAAAGGNGATSAVDPTVAVAAVVGLVALAGLGVLLVVRARRRTSGGDA
jgi:hypothetical protein